jgi:predicted O-methyltransferase YrrM
LVIFLAILVVILSIAVLLMARYIVRARHIRKQRGLFGPWPIPRIAVNELDNAFHLGPFGPTPAAEVIFIGRGNLPVLAGTSDYEAWILSVLSKSAETIVEIGTGTGKTAYLMAMNSPASAHITTMTLHPDQTSDYKSSPGDDPEGTKDAVKEAAFTDFLYSGTEAETKITQLFADSKIFDETPFINKCDLVFIDGAHTYSYVVSDSDKAMRMVRPGGLVLWHDYHGPNRAKDVYRALNEFSKAHPLLHIVGTNMVAYRKPYETVE